MQELRSTTLYYTEGSSDKVYTASLIQQAPGECVVTFAYGRRGSTLTTGKKTQVPVTQAAAERVFDKLVAEKKAKGYTPGESGSPYSVTDKESRHSGLPVQLLNAIERAEADVLLRHPFWVAQEKYDGKRMLLRKAGTVVEGVNRKSLTVGVPEVFVADARRCPADSFVLDGEAVGDTLWVFDLLELNGVDLTKAPYHRRMDALYAMMIGWLPDAIESVETADSPDKKLAMFKRIQANGGEGIVFKRPDAVHTSGRPASGGDQRKFKLYHTASCLVAKVNAQRSVQLSVLRGEATVGVGNVTIPANQTIPTQGQVVEVRYLYAYEGGSLYQPTFLGARTDVAPAECSLEQLKYKPVGQS